jgi:MarR family transcriptional regulator, temperature-dependent positive regulator of motility
MNPREQAHFRILKIIETNQDITQRELAGQIGLSLGKTNYLLNALIDKGAIKIKNFRRADNKLRRVIYLLTPAGLRERLRLTKGYIARKEAEYDALKSELEALRRDSETQPERAQG